MKQRLIPAGILITYSALLIKVMVLKDIPTIRLGSLMLNFGGTDAGHAANFVPFKTILSYVLGDDGLIIAGINLAGNIGLLLPIGLLIPFVYKTINRKKALALAVAAGLAIEVMQVVLHVGIFDVDDVILNALGVMIGYGAIRVLASWVRTRNIKNILIAASIVITATAAVLYALYPMSHQTVNAGVTTGSDPCNRTGGTGQVIGLVNNTITIKRNDNVIQTFSITDRTSFKTSAGSAAQSDVKVNDRVTLVVDDSETASAVLVCRPKS